MSENSDRIIIHEIKNDFKFKKKKTDIDINFNRVSFIFFVFFIVSIVFTIHLLHLGSRKPVQKIVNQNGIPQKLNRADIVDRNGDFLAKTVSSVDIGINPQEVIDKKKLLLNLGYIFPNKNYNKIKDDLEKNKFFWFEKKISNENYEKLMMLGDKSIKPEENLLRIYTQKNLFSHIIGQIDDDNVGISGLEKSFDQKLKDSKQAIQLSVDKNIQFLIREELLKFQKIFRSSGAAAILMNVNNGEIISIVSVPDFNPNERKNITDINYINRATKGVYELGSVFKTFTLASALNEGILEPKTKFENLEKSLTCGKNTIKEYDKNIPSDLTAKKY